MKELFGSPGKGSGLVLRIGQCFFAASSVGVMASASGFSTVTAFRLNSRYGKLKIANQALAAALENDIPDMIARLLEVEFESWSISLMP